MLAAPACLLVRRLSRAGEPEYRVVFYFSLVNVLAGLLAAAGWHAHTWRGAALLLAVGVSGTVGHGSGVAATFYNLHSGARAQAPAAATRPAA
jgi:hypothetical protein